jgi:hypothetical protein
LATPFGGVTFGIIGIATKEKPIALSVVGVLANIAWLTYWFGSLWLSDH